MKKDKEAEKMQLHAPVRRGHLKNEVIAAAIKGSLGNVSWIAKKLGVSRCTIWRRISSSAELKELFDEETLTMLDNAENELISLMNPSINEDPRSRLEAIKFYLNCRGAERGYNRNMGVNLTTGAERKPIQPVIVFESPDDDKSE